MLTHVSLRIALGCRINEFVHITLSFIYFMNKIDGRSIRFLSNLIKDEFDHEFQSKEKAKVSYVIKI